jgi:hypothetical protein
MKECKHIRFIKDKKTDFAYCEDCLMCFKDGKWITKEEYKKKYLSNIKE